MASDYPILGAPTITATAFHNVLASAGSPMAAESQGIYNAYVAAGVNPAIGLAIAQKESGFGKLGIAVGRNDPYGMRYYAGTPGASNAGGWASFASYTAAAKAHAALLASSLYGKSANYGTARTFPFRYAPTSDGNAPAAYGAFIASSLAKWGAGVGVAYTAPKTPTAKMTTTAPKAKAPTTAVKASAPASGTSAPAATPSRHGAVSAIVLGACAAAVIALVSE